MKYFEFIMLFNLACAITMLIVAVITMSQFVWVVAVIMAFINVSYVGLLDAMKKI